MKDNLIFSKRKTNSMFSKMEDDLNYSKIKDDLKFFKNDDLEGDFCFGTKPKFCSFDLDFD